MFRFSLAALAAIALMACGGSTSGPSSYCDIADYASLGDHYCYGWAGSDNYPQASFDAISSTCTSSLGGTVVSGCPAANRLGTCTYTITSGGYTLDYSISLYSDGTNPLTLAEAQSLCTTIGTGYTTTWTAG